MPKLNFDSIHSNVVETTRTVQNDSGINWELTPLTWVCLGVILVAIVVSVK